MSIWAPKQSVHARCALHIGSEAEVDAEIGVTLFAFRIEHSKGWQQADGEPRRPDRVAGRRDPAGVTVLPPLLLCV
jgi:hypothetical protein